MRRRNEHDKQEDDDNDVDEDLPLLPSSREREGKAKQRFKRRQVCYTVLCLFFAIVSVTLVLGVAESWCVVAV